MLCFSLSGLSFAISSPLSPVPSCQSSAPLPSSVFSYPQLQLVPVQVPVKSCLVWFVSILFFVFPGLPHPCLRINSFLLFCLLALTLRSHLGPPSSPTSTCDSLKLSGNHSVLIKLNLISSPETPSVLGHPWLASHNPHIN